MSPSDTDERRPPMGSGVQSDGETLAANVARRSDIAANDAQRCGCRDEAPWRLVDPETDADRGPCPYHHPSRRGSMQAQKPPAGRVQIVDGDAWFASAWAVMKTLAAEGRPFTADDLWHDRFGLDKPEEPNRVGSLFRAARERGVIQRVGFERSRTASRAGGTVASWVGCGAR